MNTAVLDGVMKVDGVLGCTVLDHEGNCLIDRLQPPFEPILLAETLAHVREALAVFSSSDDEATASGASMSQLILVGSEGQLLIRQIGTLFVIGIASISANLSMINVALNVVEAKLKRDPRAASAAPIRPSGRSFAERRDAAVTSPDDMQRTTVSRATIKEVLTALQQVMGPAGKLLLHRELVARGASASTLQRNDYQSMVEALAAQIPAARQTWFLRQVGGLLEN